MDRKKQAKPKSGKKTRKSVRPAKQPDGKKFLAAFGKRLRELREEEELSQDQLGFEVGMSRSTINRIERGHYETGIASAHLLAQALNVSMAELFEFDR